jgi:quinol-cytochrome oxidoreductase complex cytochrome b subunit
MAKTKLTETEEEVFKPILSLRKIIIISFVFLFIASILIFLNILNSVPDEPSDSGVQVNTIINTNDTGTGISVGEPSSPTGSGSFLGIPTLVFVVATGWFIYKHYLRRGRWDFL